MASPESYRIRAAFINDRAAAAVPIEVQRQEWEDAVAPVNARLGALVTPADLQGLPGEWIAARDADADHVLLFLHGGGYNVDLEIWDEMWHVWHGWAADLPDPREAIARIGAFVRQHLDSRQ